MFKVLFTVGVVAGVWFLLKDRNKPAVTVFGRFGRALGAAYQAMSASARERQGDVDPVSDGQAAPKGQAVELRPCPRCGAYVAVGTACTCTSK